MFLFFIRTGKATVAQLYSQNEYNNKFRLGLSKRIRNCKKAGKIYNSSRENLSLPVKRVPKCLSSWECNVLLPLV